MKKFETISQELWDAKAKEALDKQPLRKEISLRQLELAHNDTLMVQGKPVRLTQPRGCLKSQREPQIIPIE